MKSLRLQILITLLAPVLFLAIWATDKKRRGLKHALGETWGSIKETWAK